MKSRRTGRNTRGGIVGSIRRNLRHGGIKSLWQGFSGWVLLCFAAVIFGYAVVAFGVQTVRVVGPSMQPYLSNGDVVLVNKLYPGVLKLKRYDAVAYKLVDSDQYYDIKCVIGLPGETLRISGGDVIVDGNILDDVPWSDKIQTAGVADKVVQLDKNEYFLMGYNVNNSEDSRFQTVGNVNKSEILGKVIYRVSPKEKRGKIK